MIYICVYFFFFLIKYNLKKNTMHLWHNSWQCRMFLKRMKRVIVYWNKTFHQQTQDSLICYICNVAKCCNVPIHSRDLKMDRSRKMSELVVVPIPLYRYSLNSVRVFHCGGLAFVFSLRQFVATKQWNWELQNSKHTVQKTIELTQLHRTLANCSFDAVSQQSN